MEAATLAAERRPRRSPRDGLMAPDRRPFSQARRAAACRQPSRPRGQRVSPWPTSEYEQDAAGTRRKMTARASADA